MPIACPDALGQGVKSGRVFCEVPVSHDPAHGDLIVVAEAPGHRSRAVPSAQPATGLGVAHQGEARIHTRHGDRGRREGGRHHPRPRHGADGVPAGVDLFDRVPAGPGAKGFKAVAPIGDELVEIQVPEDAESVTVVGEKVELAQIDGVQTLSSDGVSVAFISSAQVEYRAAPAPKPAKPPAKATPKKKATTKKTAPKKTATTKGH